MNFEVFFLLIFAGLTLVSSFAVVVLKNSVKAALCLVLALVSCAPIWLLLHAEFLAIVLVLVYVGAVMVLFLFVIMMLDIEQQNLTQKITPYIPLALLVGGVFIIELLLLIFSDSFQTVDMVIGDRVAIGSNTKQIGYLLYTEHLLSFELVALVLLVAMIIALVLTIGNEHQAESKYLNESEQIRVRAADRIRMVKLPAEQPEDSNQKKRSKIRGG